MVVIQVVQVGEMCLVVQTILYHALNGAGGNVNVIIL